MTDTDRLPPWIAHPVPSEGMAPEHKRILAAYCAELVTDYELAQSSWMTIMESVRWWNSGAPELDTEPTPAGEQLAKALAFIDAGGEVPADYLAALSRQDHETRLGRAMPSPYRPGWRAPRSRHAPKVAE